MIQSTGGEWTVEDLDATGRLYQLPFYPEAHRSNGCSIIPELRSGAVRSVLTEWSRPPLDL